MRTRLSDEILHFKVRAWGRRQVKRRCSPCRRPAARALLALDQFLDRPRDAAPARRWLLRVLHPADEFVATERREILPQCEDLGIRADRGLKVIFGLMNDAMEEFVRAQPSSQSAHLPRTSITGRTGEKPAASAA